MRSLFLVVFLVVQAFSLDIPCENGEEIKSRPLLSDAHYMQGNWSYVYHWDDKNHYSVSPVDLSQGSRALDCPYIFFEFVDPHCVTKKKNKCGGTTSIDWFIYDLLQVDSPALNLKDAIIFLSDSKNYLLKDCITLTPIDVKVVSGDLMVIKDLDAGVTMLLSRQPMWSHDLDCLVHNLDVGKNLYGSGMCY